MQTVQQKSFDLQGRKLFVAIPAYDFKVTMKLAIALAQLSQKVMQHGIGIQIGSICGCSVVSRARNLLVYNFLESDCTDLLFIDADINFEPDDVLRLLAWGSDTKGIVAGVPRTRREPKRYITVLDYDEKTKELTMNNMGLVRACRVATAFMLVRRKVFETLRDTHPEWQYAGEEGDDRILHSYFDFKSTSTGYMGEDFLFCDRVREAGFEVWIDPTIKLGHMGVMEYMGDFGNDILYPMFQTEESEQKEVA